MFDKKEYDKKYRQEHKEKLRIYFKKYHHQHKDSSRKSHQKSVWKLKTEVLTHYGGGECKCVQCNFDDVRALTLDHIRGKGGEHRKLLGQRSSGYYFYLDLKRQGFPSGYQTLCSNCQRIKQVEQNEWRKPVY